MRHARWTPSISAAHNRRALRARSDRRARADLCGHPRAAGTCGGARARSGSRGQARPTEGDPAGPRRRAACLAGVGAAGMATVPGPAGVAPAGAEPTAQPDQRARERDARERPEDVAGVPHHVGPEDGGKDSLLHAAQPRAPCGRRQWIVGTRAAYPDGGPTCKGGRKVLRPIVLPAVRGRAPTGCATHMLFRMIRRLTRRSPNRDPPARPVLHRVRADPARPAADPAVRDRLRPGLPGLDQPEQRRQGRRQLRGDEPDGVVGRRLRVPDADRERHGRHQLHDHRRRTRRRRSPAASTPGANVKVTIGCQFQLLTPFLDIIIANPVAVTGSSAFPIRSGLLPGVTAPVVPRAPLPTHVASATAIARPGARRPTPAATPTPSRRDARPRPRSPTPTPRPEVHRARTSRTRTRRARRRLWSGAGFTDQRDLQPARRRRTSNYTIKDQSLTKNSTGPAARP